MTPFQTGVKFRLRILSSQRGAKVFIGKQEFEVGDENTLTYDSTGDESFLVDADTPIQVVQYIEADKDSPNRPVSLIVPAVEQYQNSYNIPIPDFRVVKKDETFKPVAFIFSRANTAKMQLNGGDWFIENPTPVQSLNARSYEFVVTTLELSFPALDISTESVEDSFGVVIYAPGDVARCSFAYSVSCLESLPDDVGFFDVLTHESPLPQSDSRKPSQDESSKSAYSSTTLSTSSATAVGKNSTLTKSQSKLASSFIVVFSVMVSILVVTVVYFCRRKKKRGEEMERDEKGEMDEELEEDVDDELDEDELEHDDDHDLDDGEDY